MNTQQIFYQFNTSINWNGFFYIAQKISYTFLTFILYRTLTSTEFAAWANINSIIFLILLWIDFGFRKSVPRYIPEFAKNKTAHQNFIIAILLTQTCLIIIMIPILNIATNYSGALLNLSINMHISAISISMLFAAEGILAILRLIFHAHFWQKQFNSINAFFLMIETLSSFIAIHYYSGNALLNSIITNKIGASLATIIFSLFRLPHLYKQIMPQTEVPIPSKLLSKQFVIHSAVMWINTALRSLSERNFMIPIITYNMGPEMAGMYKIANDGALVFQRIIIKTIGTSDTSLLAHIYTLPNKTKLMEIAFEKLTTKVASLCFPFFGLFILFAYFIMNHINDHVIIKLFCIITGSYLLEIMLLAYERLLEVERSYRFLMAVYITYAIMFFFILWFNKRALIGFIETIALVSIVRLVSLLIMYYTVYRTYHFTSKLQDVIPIAIRTSLLVFIFYFITTKVPLAHSFSIWFLRVVMNY
ncbi:MAG: oligosaccharide flippase family protein [Candidatus Babeliales bacterium]